LCHALAEQDTPSMKKPRRSSLEHRRKAMKRARRKLTKAKAGPAEATPSRRAVRTQEAPKPIQAAKPKPVQAAPKPQHRDLPKLPDRKDRRDAKTAVRKAARRAVRTSYPVKGQKPAQPAQAATSKPAQAATSKPVKPAKPKSDPQRTIYVGIERNTRMMIKWPSVLSNLRMMFTYDPDAEGGTSELCRVQGRIVESEKQKTSKKLAPLNYSTAVEALKVLKSFRKAIRAIGANYNIEMSPEFITWFNEEEAAKDLCRQAYKLLDYDDTVQLEYPFLKKPLYPWQAAAMQFLNVVTRGGSGAFLCDDTGLGKSWELAAHIAWLKHNKAAGGGKSVLVVPAALRLPWQRKLREATTLTTKVLNSDYCRDAHKYDVLIVSYDALQGITGKASRTKRDGTETRTRSPKLWFLRDLIEKQQRVLVLDEGHFAKNYDSARAQMCLYLAEYAKHSIVLTATPIKNRIKELHPLLRITRRLWTGASMKEFVRMYKKPEDQVEIAEHLVGEGGFMVRRLTPEVWLDAPNSEVGRAPVDLSNWEDYEGVENDFIAWLGRQGADPDKIMRAERGYILAQLNMLRQHSANGKIKPAIRIVGDTLRKGEQVVVFSAFNAPLDALVARFKTTVGTTKQGKRWKGAGIIKGGQSDKKRMAMIDDFQAGKTGLMCVNVAAGGFGVDLFASRVAYFMDLPWSPADFEQCTGRLLRLGQKFDCSFIKLLATRPSGVPTIDNRMEGIIFSKAQTFQRAIGDQGIVERVNGQDYSTLQLSVAKQILGTYLRDLAA